MNTTKIDSADLVAKLRTPTLGLSWATRKKAADRIAALEACKAERDRLREMVLRAADQCDKWVKETYGGGWSTHQVQSQRALAESLRLATFQKED